jgi:hypothetical protein
MSYDGWQERQRAPGQPHSGDHAPLLTPPQTPSRRVTPIVAKPSDRLRNCAERYLRWFTAGVVDREARYNMMASNTATRAIDREIELIKMVRQFCPDLRVDMNKSDMGWNEKSNTAFLLLYLNGTHSRY